MNDQKLNELVAAWFEGDGGGTMHEACSQDPETAWQSILQILTRELADDEKSLLAAGPLEDLLALHGSTFIDRMEAEAKRNPRFNDLLGGVWPRRIPREIWERIEKVRKAIW